MSWDPVGDAAEALVQQHQALLADLETSIGWLEDAADPPKIRDMAMTVMWRANLVVDSESGTWASHEMWEAYDGWEKLSAPEDPPTDGHLDAWKYAAKRVSTAARDFCSTARDRLDLRADSLIGVAAVGKETAFGLENGAVHP
jgi:hypothetical protein